MAETKQKQIGKYSYTCSPLTGKKAIKVFVRLCNVLGPAVKGLDIAAAIEQDESAAAASLMSGVAEALMSLKDSDLEYLVEMFSANCDVALEPGKTPKLSQLGDDFWGVKADFTDIFPWLFFCIQTSYASFLQGKSDGFLTALGLRRKDSSISKSPEESTGIVGASS